MCYSIYLVHYALFVMVQRFLGPVGRLPALVAPLVSLLVLAPLAVVVGAAFFVVVERPCMDPEWLDRLIGRIRGIIAHRLVPRAGSPSSSPTQTWYPEGPFPPARTARTGSPASPLGSPW
jgi:peptidoglycan/LPS O-acetylase OafA/YrhL